MGDILFLDNLSKMTERVKCFNQNFNSKSPRFEMNFVKRNFDKAVKDLQSEALKKTFDKTAFLYREAHSNLFQNTFATQKNTLSETLSPKKSMVKRDRGFKPSLMEG